MAPADARGEADYEAFEQVGRNVAVQKPQCTHLRRTGVRRTPVVGVPDEVGEADLAVAPHTTDGDLAIDPTRLGKVPPLEQVLAQAGFRPRT